MTETYRYDAFISYRHVEPDRKWAKWLHKALETFKTPDALVQKGVRARVKRVFRDEEELPASADLSREIDVALTESRFLVVVCSPRTPASAWVNQEVVRFREMGRDDRILALLIEGEPSESFPQALCEIRTEIADEHGQIHEEITNVEPLAADVRASRTDGGRQSRRTALLRVASCLLGCRFDDLRQRDQERQRRRLLAIGTVLAILVAGFATLALLLFGQLELAKAERDLLAIATESRDVLDEHASLLWPHGPPGSKYRAWSRRAEALMSVREALRAEREALEAQLASSVDPKLAWRVQTHLGIENRLERLAELIPAIQQRLKRTTAAEVESTAWRQARELIRGLDIYGGLDLPPQVGLIPLGRNGASGLYEFAHAASGKIPEWVPSSERVDVRDSTGMVFVLLPGGEFTQGSRFDAEADTDVDPVETPERRVRVQPFFISKYELTRSQWERVGGRSSDADRGGAAHPVGGMSWVHARQLLSSRSLALRLPTESEWEYACRAGGARDRFGSDETAEELASRAWFNRHDPGDLPRSILSGSAGNRFGLHDMHGNIAEWCEDSYVAGYEGAPEDGGARLTPADPRRVVRGGDFRSGLRAMRAGHRDWELQDNGHPDLGLRLARSAEGLR